MALRFRKSVKLAPGVRLNLGKKGASVSLGGRGASVNLSSRGTYLNTSLPGTGISARAKLSGSDKTVHSSAATQYSEELTVEVGERGELIIEHDGLKAPPKFVKAMWEQKEKELLALLKKELKARQEIENSLSNIYQQAPKIDKLPDFKPSPFTLDKPEKPTKPQKIPKPTAFKPPRLGLLKLLSSKERAAHALRKQQAVDDHQRAIEQWRSDTQTQRQRYDELKASYPDRLAQWKERKAEFEAKQKHFKTNYQSLIWQDVELMEQALEAYLNTVVWPRETLVDYSLKPGMKTIYLDVDLPEIEDFPQYTFEMHESQRRLKATKKRVGQLREQYANHVLGIAIALARHCFAQLPGMEHIVMSGYSQRPDKQTNAITDEYLYSIKFTREKLNLSSSKYTPLMLPEYFDMNVKLSKNFTFSPIEPFSE